VDLNFSLHGVEISLLVTLIVMLFKQYAIYKAIRERMNIIWREYCREHEIPYNAVGDDVLIDIKNGGGFKH
jgi:hypothetical protein